MDEAYEQVLLVKNEVFIFMIPPRTSNRAVRASDWKLDAPDWTGRLKLITKGDKCFIRLEDKVTGQEYAKCPIDKYPGIAIEPVSDSSRYFVVRVQDDDGRAAFIGMGFADRGDSFDLNVALQDHFKLVEKQCKLEQEALSDNQPKLDLKFKEGQTIKVNLNIKKSGTSTSRPKPKATGNITGILPPPPGGLKLGNSSIASKQDKSATSSISFNQESKISNTTTSSDVKSSTTTNYLDDLTDLQSLSISQATTASHSEKPGSNSASEAKPLPSDEWANFEDAFSNQPSSLPADSKAANTQQSNWACF